MPCEAVAFHLKYVGSDVASLYSEAAMQQICKKMYLIDLDKDTLSLLMMENSISPLAQPISSP